jgi:plasmid stability protein
MYTVGTMGIVKISDEIHSQLRIAAGALDRSLNSQAEHWLKIGMLSELSQTKTYEELRNFLFENDALSIKSILKEARKK